MQTWDTKCHQFLAKKIVHISFSKILTQILRIT